MPAPRDDCFALLDGSLRSVALLLYLSTIQACQLMSNILIVYSTTDGHTFKICRHIKTVVEQQGDHVTLVSVDEASDTNIAKFDKVVIGASIRYGRHAREVYSFIARNKTLLDRTPNAFFSVNLVARKPGRDTPETNPYLKRFLRQISWRPNELAVFAGKIDYPRYRFLDRQIIRFIMWMTNGPTDPSAVVEFTDWNKVEAFGILISKM